MDTGIRFAMAVRLAAVPCISWITGRIRGRLSGSGHFRFFPVIHWPASRKKGWSRSGFYILNAFSCLQKTSCVWSERNFRCRMAESFAGQLLRLIREIAGTDDREIMEREVSGGSTDFTSKTLCFHFFNFLYRRHIMLNKTSSIKRITLLGSLFAVLVVMGFSDLAEARSSSGGRSFGGSSSGSGGFGSSPSSPSLPPPPPSGGGSFSRSSPSVAGATVF